jgi:hypothetical protein
VPSYWHKELEFVILSCDLWDITFGQNYEEQDEEVEDKEEDPDTRLKK